MGPKAIPEHVASCLEQIRARLLTGLHLGRYKPGDRAPSIRRMAALTRFNPKTVQRAYRQLTAEGLLDVRWGSGTFFSDARGKLSHKPLPGSLLVAVERCRVEADHLGVEPEVFSRFLEMAMGRGLRDLPLAVAECNREQIGLIQRELQAGLGVATHEVLISDLVAHHPSLLSAVRGVVTTDCHLREVSEMVAGRVPVYRVALEPEFTHLLIRHARKGTVLMVVRDRRYAPVFKRMLAQMQVPPEIVDRLRIVSRTDLAPGSPATDDVDAVYVSPLVARRVEIGMLRGIRRIRGGSYLAPSSVEALRAQLALDLALSR